MAPIFTYKTKKAWIWAFVLFATGGSLRAAQLQDIGIYQAGPFPVPDITKPPSASAEAVFLAGSTQHAPFYLNEFVVNSSNSGQWSNNGWVGGQAFDPTVTSNGSQIWIQWNLSGTGYALTFISVNFDNDFYHVYRADRLANSDGIIAVTGNQRDMISRIRVFGVRTVPEGATTVGMLVMGLASLGALGFVYRHAC
jgi:hypothetical protein